MATRIKEGMTGAEVAQIIDNGFDNLEELNQRVETNETTIEDIKNMSFVSELMGIGTTKEEVNINYRGMSQGISFEFQRTIPSASALNAGVMTSDDKTILDDLASKENLIIPVDEEDITSESGALKFKDKEYDEANFSGKGYKILRKNIVEGKNVLTQDMINDSNTVYEIRYDFDLNDATILMPYNSSINFKNGSLNNGKIQFRQNSQLYGNPKLINIETVKQSFQYFPKLNNIYSFNLSWFGKDDLSGLFPNFNSYYDNFIKFLGAWDEVNHFDIRLYVPGGVYYLTSSFYVPNWLSIDFGYSELQILEESAIYDDYIIKVNVNQTEYQSNNITWVQSYPRKSGYIKNLILSGYYNKGILALDNREYKNLTFHFDTNNPEKEYISLDQYPEGDLYMDNTHINGINSVIGDNQNISRYAWVKLGTGDAGIFEHIAGCRLFIYNRQGFVLNGGIQCYPYIVCSIGKLMNIHNEFAVDSYIISSIINFDSCIFYRKNDIEGINIFNIVPARELKSYDNIPFTLSFKTEVTTLSRNYTTFNDCRFLYNYRAHNYNFYDINIVSIDVNTKEHIMCNNTYKTFYGYGSQNQIQYKLKINTPNTTNSTKILYNDRYDKHLQVRNSRMFYLESDAREKTENEQYGTIVNTGSYNYYAAFKFRNNIYRLNQINVVANSNWNLLKLYCNGIPDECYLIREYDSQYKIAVLENLHLSDSIYCEDCVIDWGDILSTRSVWQDYSSDQFNQLIVLDDKDLYNLYYNIFTDRFIYNSKLGINYASNLQNLQDINDLFTLLPTDLITCNNIEYQYIDSQISEKNKIKGTTQNRPTYSYIGKSYFDTTLNKPIWWNGTKWVDYNGNDADVKTSGTTAQRPSDVITGFQYFDTDINSPVYWNGIEWIKPATDTGVKVVKITQTEYDSLEPKDPNTLYAIISDSTIQ